MTYRAGLVSVSNFWKEGYLSFVLPPEHRIAACCRQGYGRDFIVEGPMMEPAVQGQMPPVTSIITVMTSDRELEDHLDEDFARSVSLSAYWLHQDFSQSWHIGRWPNLGAYVKATAPFRAY